ncbi:MAG: serine/threonine-protein kinase [bacterium]
MSTPPGFAASNTKPNDSPDALVGRLLDGRYRLDRVLSAGGMGLVYLATQMTVQRQVAIKIIKPTLARNNDLVQRFMHEIEISGRLSHPNIVALIDTGRDLNGLNFIVMEFVQGETFRDALMHSRLSLLEILHVFVQVCDALIEAHELGIIHRDLKFENIMICRNRDNRIHTKVLDFGVAKQLFHDKELTRVGEIPGTPGIIAPELLDSVEPSAQSDLYSLGVLLFTSLTGRAPFEGETDFELMRAHKMDDVPDLYRLVGDQVPEEIIELAYELMVKDPKARPASAEAVRDRLEKIIRRLERQMMDHPRYVPPAGAGLRPLQAPRVENLRSQEFQARPAPEDPLPEAVAPASVVAVLIVIVMVLVVIVIYLLYQQHLALAQPLP